MLLSCPAAAREADPAGMSSGEPSATKAMGGLLLNPVLIFYSGLSQPFMRGHQRLTFRQYSSYSAPNFGGASVLHTGLRTDARREQLLQRRQSPAGSRVRRQSTVR